MAAKRAREMTRKKSVLEISNLPGKLADCSSKEAEKCELFIVEGDSGAFGLTPENEVEFHEFADWLRGLGPLMGWSSDTRVACAEL